MSDEIIEYHINCLKNIDNNLTYIVDKIDHLAENVVFPEKLAEYESLSGYNKFEVSKEITDVF